MVLAGNYFDFSSSAWFSGLNKILKYKLQVTQNKVARFILNLQPRTSINCSVLSKINMLKVEDSAKQLRLNYVLIFIMNMHDSIFIKIL